MEVESRSAADSCKKKLEMFILKSSDVKEKNLAQISFGRQSLRLSGDDKIEKWTLSPKKLSVQESELKERQQTQTMCIVVHESNTGKKNVM